MSLFPILLVDLLAFSLFASSLFLSLHFSTSRQVQEMADAPRGTIIIFPIDNAGSLLNNNTPSTCDVARRVLI